MSARKKRIIISIGFLVVLYGILILVFIVLPEAKEERSVVKAVVTETTDTGNGDTGGCGGDCRTTRTTGSESCYGRRHAYAHQSVRIRKEGGWNLSV